MENHKDKEWLYIQHVKLGKSGSSIAKELGIPKRTVYYYLNKFSLNRDLDYDVLYNLYIEEDFSLRKIAKILGISVGKVKRALIKTDLLKKKKDPKYKDFLYLKEEYLDKNRSSIDIASEFEVSDETIRYWINKFNILKSDEDKRNRYLLSMDKKYGLNKIKIGEENYFITKLSEEYNVPYYLIKKISNEEVSSKKFQLMIKTWDGIGTSLEKYFSHKMDIDIYNKLTLGYRPDFKINENTYLNVDGLYWHSEKIKGDKKYHFNLRKTFEDNGLRIFQFRSDEIYNKFEIVKSMIDIKLHNKCERIFGRKTVIKEISNLDAKKFLNENHIMGAVAAKHIGIFYKEKLCLVMSYKRYKEGIKIERLASLKNTVIIGGFSKALNHIERKYSPLKIYYWVDLRYGTGDFLLKKNFYIEKETLGWKWTDFKNTYNRLRCRANMDERRLTQLEYSKELKWVKIYDAGQRLYIKDCKKGKEEA